MSFIIMLLLCICNYSYTAEQLYDHYDYDIYSFTTALFENELLDYHQEIVTDNFSDLVDSSQTNLTPSSSTRLSEQSEPHTEHIFNTSKEVTSNELYASSANTKPITSDLNNREPRSINASNNTLHVCPITSCNKDIRGPKKNLHHHVAIVHYRCYQCGYAEVYTDKDTFIAHLSTHRKNTASIVKYLSRYKKRQPIESCANDLDQMLLIRKATICPVSSCRAQLNRGTSTFKIHMAAIHNRCALCKQLSQFFTLQELYNHITSSHPKGANTLITYLSNLKSIQTIKYDLNKQESLSRPSDNHDHEQEHVYIPYQNPSINFPDNSIMHSQSMDIPVELSRSDEIIDYKY